MNRRGFISGVMGLAGAVVGGKVLLAPTKATTAKPTMRLRQVLVDARDIQWASPEGEKVIMHMLHKHQSVTRRFQNNL